MDIFKSGLEFVNIVEKFRVGIQDIESCLVAVNDVEKKYGIGLVAAGMEYNIVDGDLVGKEIRNNRLLQNPDNEILEDIFVKQLFPFLSETNAFLWSAYPDTFDMIFQDRYFFHVTSRAYASTYARWANVTEWLGASNWDYRQFYYAQGFTSESYEWLQTLYRVIKDREVRID